MASYRALVAELVGTIPRLPYLHAQGLINRAWSDVQDLRLWGFNIVTNAQIFLPAVITAGAFSVTFGNNQAVGNATAKATLNAVAGSPFPPLFGLVGNGRQIRFSSAQSTTGPIYTIVNYDGATGTVFLDRPYGESTNSLATYQVYACYNRPRVSGSLSPYFVRYMSINNPSSGYSIRGRKLYYTQAQINAIDPQRGATGDPYVVAFYAPDSNGSPVHEFYPHPVNFSTLTCSFQQRLPDLTDSFSTPAGMSYDLEGLLISKAKALSAEWALANVGTYPELQRTNWVAYIESQDRTFKERRIQCIKQDDETSPLVSIIQGGQFDFPLGGQFLQSHDVSSLIP